MYRIMLIDDEKSVLKALQRSLGQNKQWELETYISGESALRRAQVANFDLFLSDYRMPDMNGVQFLCAVKEIQPEAMRIIISGFSDLDGLLGAINQAEIFRFIRKPWDDDNVIATIEQALKIRDILVENRHLAGQVKAQQALLDRHAKLVEKLEADSPGITQVKLDGDGYILLDENNV